MTQLTLTARPGGGGGGGGGGFSSIKFSRSRKKIKLLQLLSPRGWCTEKSPLSGEYKRRNRILLMMACGARLSDRWPAMAFFSGGGGGKKVAPLLVTGKLYFKRQTSGAVPWPTRVNVDTYASDDIGAFFLFKKKKKMAPTMAALLSSQQHKS